MSGFRLRLEELDFSKLDHNLLSTGEKYIGLRNGLITSKDETGLLKIIEGANEYMYFIDDEDTIYNQASVLPAGSLAIVLTGNYTETNSLRTDIMWLFLEGANVTGPAAAPLFQNGSLNTDFVLLGRGTFTCNFEFIQLTNIPQDTKDICIQFKSANSTNTNCISLESFNNIYLEYDYANCDVGSTIVVDRYSGVLNINGKNTTTGGTGYCLNIKEKGSQSACIKGNCKTSTGSGLVCDSYNSTNDGIVSYYGQIEALTTNIFNGELKINMYGNCIGGTIQAASGNNYFTNVYGTCTNIEFNFSATNPNIWIHTIENGCSIDATATGVIYFENVSTTTIALYGNVIINKGFVLVNSNIQVYGSLEIKEDFWITGVNGQSTIRMQSGSTLILGAGSRTFNNNNFSDGSYTIQSYGDFTLVTKGIATIKSTRNIPAILIDEGHTVTAKFIGDLFCNHSYKCFVILYGDGSNLATGFDWSVDPRDFNINLNDGGAINISLTANCADLSACITHIQAVIDATALNGEILVEAHGSDDIKISSIIENRSNKLVLTNGSNNALSADCLGTGLASTSETKFDEVVTNNGGTWREDSNIY